jgi:hypothetical protein
MNRLWRRMTTALRKAFSKDALRRGVTWAQAHVPPGLRSALGVLLIAGGVFGFLPVLGFWMIPLGAALIALDIPPLRRRLLAWLERDKAASSRR